MLSNSKFRPAWWLRNPHAQTLWAARVQSHPQPQTIKERINTPDNDFLDLSWSDPGESNTTSNTTDPIVIIFHGLTGSVQSHYVRSLMHHLTQRGVRSVLMHFRGCSGEPNKTPGSYHSAHTTDISYVIDLIKARYPATAIAAAGFSLGGNALLKYLATQPENPLQFAVSVSPPLVLAEGAQRMNRGFSKMYQHVLLEQLKQALRNKHQRYPQFNLDKLQYESTKNFYEFDHQVTAPLHGYTSGADYYNKASTLNDLINIKTNTHILWSQDDPFFSKACIPTNHQLSQQVEFELSRFGGHVAYVGRRTNIATNDKPDWLSQRLGSLLCKQLLGKEVEGQ